MKQLGISIYPEKMAKEEMIAYIERAHQAGCSRIFSCLLSIQKPKEAIKQEFQELNAFAHSLGFEVILDVSPKVFQELGISYQEPSFFHEVGADGIRLDQGFTGNEEALMTFNPYGLHIEINMSNDVSTIDTIMQYQPNRKHLYGCHNFYPHAYTGLDLDFFKRCSRRFQQYGLRTAAFISSQAPQAFGPWPITQGLPTLELHRHLPLDVQLKHLILLDLVEDAIISNCVPTEAEWEAIATLSFDQVTFDLTLCPDLPQIERKIVLEELHFNRGDQNPNVIRSTQSRVKYKGHEFALFHAPKFIHRGDVIIESSLYGHYAGEVQIARCEMENSGKSNVVGHIREVEHFLLDELAPWQKFRFRVTKS